MVENIGGRRIEFYSDIKELPIDKFTNFRKYVMMDSIVNPHPDKTVGIVDVLISKCNEFHQAEKNDLIIKELMSFRQAIWTTINGVNISNLSLATLVKSIDKKEVTVETEEEIEQTSKYLNKATLKAQQKILTHLKKNFLGI